MEEEIKIEKIRTKELASYLDTKRFLRLDNIPITPYRVNSYINNPRSKPEDIVLYLLYKEQELISYRSILSDTLFTNSDQLHIGWFSGNWTHPEYRRKGYSSLLLDEVRKDWEDRLLFSNYAPASKDVLDQTGGFSLIQVLEGQRYYFKFSLGELLPPKSSFFKKIKPLLSGLDYILNRFITHRKYVQHVGSWEKFSTLSKEDVHFLSKLKDGELFRRTKEEYDWILKYPWIQLTSAARKWDDKYHFSCFAHHFDLSFYRIKVKGVTEGIIMISVMDKVIKVQYAYLNKAALPIAAQCLLQLAIREKALHLTVFHKALIKELNKFKRFYLFRKKFDQAFLTSKKVLAQFPEIRKKEIQKGDGDAIFT